MRVLVASMVTCALSAPLGACPPMQEREALAQSNDLRIYYAFEAQPVVGQPFAVSVRACNGDGTFAQGRISADATMPAHGHGMNYAPRPVPLVNGTARVEIGRAHV